MSLLNGIGNKIIFYILICTIVFIPLSGALGGEDVTDEGDKVRENIIHEDLQEDLARSDEPVEALVILEEKADTAGVARSMKKYVRPFVSDKQAKSLARRAVIDTLKDTAEKAQAPLLEYLEEEKGKGNVREINDFFIVNALYLKAEPTIIKELAQKPAVEKIEPNRTFEIQEGEKAGSAVSNSDVQSNDNVEWGVEQINAHQVWDEFDTEGEGVVVGVLDTGVNWEHEALQEKYRGYCPDGEHEHTYSWYDAVNYENEPVDVFNDHGTHVTGIALGADPDEENQIGVAPGAQWIAANAFQSDGDAYVSDLLEAGEYLLEPGGDAEKAPDIINCSWGGGTVNGDHEWFRDMVQSWRDAGIMPVVAAGNTDGGADPGSILIPAIYPESVAVGATDKDDQRADFSNRGPTEYYHELKPNISAPGVGIRSATSGTSGYGTKNGTSMATPHIAGAVALMLSFDPGLSVDELEEALYATASSQTDSDYGHYPNYGYGYGIVNAYDAVDLLKKGHKVHKLNLFSTEGGGIKKEVEKDGEEAYLDIYEYYELYVFDEITVKAEPNDPYRFVEWTDGEGNLISKEKEYTFDVEEDVVLVANFKDEFEVKLSAEPEEGGQVKGEGFYEPGEEVSVKAISEDGYTFVHWTEDDEVVSEEKEYVFEIEEDRELVGNFKKEYEVSLSAAPEDGGRVEGAGIYTSGEQAEVKATSEFAYAFINWTEDDEVVSEANEYAFEVVEDRELVANFEKITVDSIDLNKEELELMVGEERFLQAEITPDDAPNQDIKWESTDEDVAEVNDYGSLGKVNALEDGETQIRATVIDTIGGEEYTAECIIKVTGEIDDYLEVKDTDPAGGEDSVKVNKVIRAYFNVPIRESEDFEDITLTVKGEDEEIAIERNIEKGRNLMLKIAEDDMRFAYNTDYEVYIPQGAVECKKYGSKIEEDYSFEFTTAEEEVLVDKVSLKRKFYQVGSPQVAATMVPQIEPDEATDYGLNWTNGESGEVKPTGEGNYLVTSDTGNDIGEIELLYREDTSWGVFRALSPGTANVAVLAEGGDVKDEGVIDVFFGYGIVTSRGPQEDLEPKAKDAVKILQYIVGLAEFDRVQKQAANVTGSANNEVKVGDAISVLRKVVGLIDEFPVENEED